MSGFISTGVLLIAVWAVAIVIRSVFRNKTEHEDHVRRVEGAINLVKKAINSEERGATVDAKKDKERLQKKIQEVQTVPKKYQNQAQKELERYKQFLEEEKQKRISSFKRDLEFLEVARNALRSNQANYHAVKVMAQNAILNACKQRDIDINDIDFL